MAAPHELFAYSAHWTTSAPAGAVSSVKICPTRADKPTYIAIALSGGPTAVRWAVETFDDVPSGGWSDVYRTRKLVLRRIPAGSFEMGVRASDLPGAATDLRGKTAYRKFLEGIRELCAELGNGSAPGDARLDTPAKKSLADNLGGDAALALRVFDCRGLPNPFWESGLRGFSGKDEPVVAFFREREAEIAPFLDAAESLVLQTIRAFQTDGRTRLQAAFGCTGGQHRSVYMAERLAERLRRVPGVSVEVVHLAESHWRIGGSAGAQ